MSAFSTNGVDFNRRCVPALLVKGRYGWKGRIGWRKRRKEKGVGKNLGSGFLFCHGRHAYIPYIPFDIPLEFALRYPPTITNHRPVEL
jgi:hypothetical protein